MRIFYATYARANLAKVMRLVDQREEVTITYRPRKGQGKALKFKLTMIPGHDDIFPSYNSMKLLGHKTDD